MKNIIFALLLFVFSLPLLAQPRTFIVDCGATANAITVTKYFDLPAWQKIDSVCVVLVDKAQNVNIDSVNFYPGVNIAGTTYTGASASFSTSVITQISTLAAVGNQLLLTSGGATPLTAAALRGYNTLKITMAGSPTGNTAANKTYLVFQVYGTK